MFMRKQTEKKKNTAALRKQAEERLGKPTAKPLQELSAEDSQYLIHELKVQQLELKMQNEELRFAQETLEESRSRYSDLYDFAPIGYFTLDKHGLILDANLTGAEQLGIERHSLIKKPFTRFMHKDSADIFYFHSKEVMKKEKRKSCQVRIKRKDNAEYYAQLVSIAVKDSDGNLNHMRTAVIDITYRVQVEKIIKQSEESYQRLLESISDGILILDHKWRYILVNNAIEKMTGKSRSELLGKKIMDVFPGIEDSKFSKAFKKVIKTGRPAVATDSFTFEDGRKGWFEIHTYPVPEGIFIIASDITMRKEAEENVKRKQQVTERLLDSLPHSAMLIRKDRKIIAANKMAREVGAIVGGYCWQEFGKCQFIPEEFKLSIDKHGKVPDGARCYFCDANDALERKVPVSSEVNAWDRLWDTNWVPLDEETYLHYAIDITERKRAEEALNNSHKDLDHAQAIAHIGSWRLNVQKNELAWSDESYRICGITKDTPLTYETFLSIVHPDDREYVDRMWNVALQGEPYDIEHRILVDGNVKWVRERAELEFDRDGRLIGGFGTCQDITDRKRVEDDLRELRRKNQMILDAAGEGIYGLDANGNTTFVNPAAAAMIGWKVKELIGKNQHDILHHTKSDGTPYPKDECPIYAAFKDGKVHQSDDEVFWRKDGSSFPVEYISTPIWDKDKKLIGSVVIFMDITKRKEAEDELEKHRNHLKEMVDERTRELKETYMELNKEITEKLNYQAEAVRSAELASIGELAAGVAHEINNPINGIINCAQMLINKYKPESKDHKVADIIRKESDRIASIVASLLTLSRTDVKKKSLVQVNDIMADIISLNGAQLRKDGITLEVDMPGDLPLINGNFNQLQQVFLNILSNARYAINEKYPGSNNNKTIKIKGEKAAVDSKPLVRLTFFDNGVGIPYDILNKIMSPFFTTKPANQGTGLGLSISHGILNDHGGTIKIDSILGQLTKVTIDLPVNK
jgi:PAS domain S-box-containing protein